MERRDEASAPRLLLSPSEPLMYVKAALDTLHYTCKVDLGLPPPGEGTYTYFLLQPAVDLFLLWKRQILKESFSPTSIFGHLEDGG